MGKSRANDAVPANAETKNAESGVARVGSS